jgi:hypothetical protein
MWIDEARGNLVDWTTQQWVQATGRRVSLAECPWLDGPCGGPAVIGPRFFEEYAATRALVIQREGQRGLVQRFGALAGTDFDPGSISRAVSEFYEQTSAFEFDAWSQWCGAFRPFGWALAVLFSRRLQQLNVPLSGLDTSRGMTSEVVSICDPESRQVLFSGWTRQLLGTGHVIYAGAYSTCRVPNHAGPCVRVVFPLPNGNAIVIMRPVARDDGSLLLVSAGDGFGSPGFYFTVHRKGVVWAKYVRGLRESIHVFGSPDGVRADHVLSLFGATFLRLHYRLRRRSSSQAGEPEAAFQIGSAVT